jgi:hypothetical protein
MNLALFIRKKYAFTFFSKDVRSICDGRHFHKQELLRHCWLFKKHQTEDAKWREDASKQEGRLCVVNQLKQDDLIELKLDFSGRAIL